MRGLIAVILLMGLIAIAQRCYPSELGDRITNQLIKFKEAQSGQGRLR